MLDWQKEIYKSATMNMYIVHVTYNTLKYAQRL